MVAIITIAAVPDLFVLLLKASLEFSRANTL
jgi:hypothetical protein